MIKYFLILINIIFSIEFEAPYMEEYMLDNGMTIILAPTYEQPVVSIEVLVGAGEINAGINKYFVADLTSELMCYENQNYNHDELSKYIDNFGLWGPWSYTAFDYTKFVSRGLKENIENLISLNSEILRYPSYNKKRFNHELNESIRWHKWRVEDRPHRIASFHILNMLTGINMKTFSSDSSSISLEDIKTFYNSYYYPSNIKLIISGDFNLEYAKILIEKYFSNWKEVGDVKSTKKYFSKKSDGINVRFIDQPATKKPYIGIVMPGLSAGDVDFSSFLLVNSILSRGWNGRLFHSNKLISENWDDFDNIIAWERTWNGLLYGSETSYSNIDNIFQAIKNEIKNIKQNNITKSELEAAKQYQIGKSIISFEQPSDWMAWVLGELSAGHSLEDIKSWVNTLEAVTLDDVNMAANKYWDHENFYLIVFGDKDSTETFLNQFENVEYYERFDPSK